MLSYSLVLLFIIRCCANNTLGIGELETAARLSVSLQGEKINMTIIHEFDSKSELETVAKTYKVLITVVIVVVILCIVLTGGTVLIRMCCIRVAAQGQPHVPDEHHQQQPNPDNPQEQLQQPDERLNIEDELGQENLLPQNTIQIEDDQLETGGYMNVKEGLPPPPEPRRTRR